MAWRGRPTMRATFPPRPTMSNETLFSKIIRREIPATIVYEG